MKGPWNWATYVALAFLIVFWGTVIYVVAHFVIKFW